MSMYVGELIVSNYVRSSINQQLTAGRFGHENLRQLPTKLFCMQLMKAFAAETFCNQLLIDTATSTRVLYCILDVIILLISFYIVLCVGRENSPAPCVS